MSSNPSRRVWLSVPHMGGAERRYVDQAWETNWLSTAGPNLEALEREFSQLIGQPCVAVTSGTAAIHLGVRLLGLRPGDEMVTSTLTFVGSCNPVVYEGAVPVFLDSERRTWGMDPQLLSDFLRKRSRVNRLPKAVTVVHLFGQGADMDAILQVCGQYGLPVLEDAAESLGALQRGRHFGTFGAVGAFSFNGNKIITGTSGGILTSDRVDWTDRARFWASQAKDVDPEGVRNYVHSEVGHNYRLSNVLAGIIRGQLEVLEDRVAQRRAVFARYVSELAGVPGLEAMPEWCVAGAGSRSTRYLSSFLVDEEAFGISARSLVRRLDAENIEARPVWRPMHLQPLYARHECVGGSVAADLHQRGICLPSSSSLSSEDQDSVIRCIQKAHLAAVSGRVVSGISAGTPLT